MTQPNPFDALLDAMLTKPGPNSPAEEHRADEDDVEDRDGD